MARSDLILEDPCDAGVDAVTLDALYAQVEKTVERHEGLLERV